jgi:non-ribosomal peptide synthetase component F
VYCLDAVIEQQMPMTGASMFWLDALHDCKLDQSLPLPYDRYRLSDEHRTGRGTSISFDFGQDLSHYFLTYASLNNIQPQHLALAIYYAFLFKLTNGTSDLCIGTNTDGRYKEEFMSVIGMFVNVIPLRCELDPYWNFVQLIDYVSEIVINSMKYSYFPLERILNQYSNVLKPAFFGISFEFQSNQNQNSRNEVMLGDSRPSDMLIFVKSNTDEITSKFDFSLTVHHDLTINQLSCTINASLDLFCEETIDRTAQQFQVILEQLFNVQDVQMKQPLYKLSLILIDGRLLMQSTNNSQVLSPCITCIHHEFVRQVVKHPQKLAVEFDEQSLTYSELLHYVQVLSLKLINTYHVVPDEIICQCVQRSLSMVS